MKEWLGKFELVIVGVAATGFAVWSFAHGDTLGAVVGAFFAGAALATAVMDAILQKLLRAFAAHDKTLTNSLETNRQLVAQLNEAMVLLIKAGAAMKARRDP